MRRVIVVPHDPNWAEAYVLASREVTRAMGINLLTIHHIGSTSIPGIYAKPVIDMMALVSDIAAVDHCNAPMQSLGYEAMGEFGIPGRRYFRRDNSAGDRSHQLHTFQVDSPNVDRHLAFRDFMRAHPKLAIRYSDLKRQLAAAHPTDIEAYMDGKDGFIKEMEARALTWAKPRE
jgi:GrpB-like predicted nucleotidyltransferase (UPF0157 family)